MTFKLRIPGDGTGHKSLSSCENSLGQTRPALDKKAIPSMKPKEFTITPDCGTIRPQGFTAIRVTLCSNTVQKYELALVVDVEGIGEEVLALLITARCIVPTLELVNSVVDFGHCFLKYPYEKTIELSNKSPLPGCYEVLPQVLQDTSPAVVLSNPIPCAVIPANSTIHIPLGLEAQVLGEHLSTVSICTFGSQEPPLICNVKSFGEGPVVYIHPMELDFGSIYVLQDSSRVLNLCNQAFIPARFRAYMAHKKSLWTIKPSQGLVPPETDLQLTLTANLNDIVTFKDTVILEIENSNTYRVPVRALGFGSTIVSNKPFAPELNLGAHFSLDTFSYHFKLTNKGRRVQQLFWMNEGFQPKAKLSKKSLAKTRPRKSHGSLRSSKESKDPENPIFQIHPVRMELYPDQTVNVTLQGYSTRPRRVEERLVCHAVIGTQGGKTFIMAVKVTCEFIAPLLQLSTKHVTYRLEKTPSCILKPEYKPLVMKNVSSLPLNVLLSSTGPFFICENDKSPLPITPEPILLGPEEKKSLLIKFNPSFKTDLNNWVSEEILFIKYLEHPQVDCVSLRGEVCYPNLIFENTDVNFGCILNDTEVIRYVTITNSSPLPVKFRWFFLVDDEEKHIRFMRSPVKPYSATMSQAESVTTPSICSQVIPILDCVDININDYIKTILVDEETVSEERELNKTKGPVITVSEVFDILPLYGVLPPFCTQQISFTFFGHCDIVAQAKAQCEVEGGPTYEVTLRGEASLISYSFDTKDINFGLQLFDHVTMKEITLRNTGQVGFEFKVLTKQQSTPDNLLPGEPLLLPNSAFVDSHKETKLKVYYLPGIPEVFQRSFQIQVAHLEPEKITLSGEGVFPRISLDLPRNLRGAEKYQAFLSQAQEKLEKEYSKYEMFENLEITEEMLEDESSEISAQIQMEVERLIVQDYAMEHQKVVRGPTEDFSHWSYRKLSKVHLPEYILDFGYIILGDVRTHIIKITNTSNFPVSFHADKRVLHDTGFSTELDRVKNLPSCETETFEVRLDTQGPTATMGNKEAFLPIKVVGGPTVFVCLQAKVLIPTMTLSCAKVEFATIQCGLCLVETIQLTNHQQVPCEWFVSVDKPVNKLEKHIPKYLRRRLHSELKPKVRIFEIQPTSGILDPFEKSNVQVKFIPKEEKFYSQTLMFQIAQSSQKLPLLAQGSGLEPRLEFNPSILELGPLLPFAPGDEAEVVVKNPCHFPIEFYSLEFDQQYLLEEKILRMLKGYDSYNTLLLPPRLPGDKLPPEIYDYYREVKRCKEEQMKVKYLENLSQDNDDDELLFSDHGTSASTKRTSLSQGFSIMSNPEERHIPLMDAKIFAEEEDDEESLEKMFQADKAQSMDSHSTDDAGEVDNNPVSKAIARHLGIDISPEGQLGKNRKGIAIIVHGTPMSGRSATAVSLAKYYNAACLNIDAVMLEAICDSNSFPGIRARELCIRAAIEQSMKEGEESAQEATSGQTRLSNETLGKLTSETTLISPEMRPGKSMRGSVMLTKGKMDTHTAGSQKQHHLHTSETPQIPSSPLPLGPAQRRLSVSTSIGGETGLMSCVLPEDLFVQIMSDRLELSDCYRGVVFDSLDTLFARNTPSALLSLLKAIGNREHIYLLNMAQDYTAMKAQEKAKKEQEENKRKEELEREKARLQNMDEDEYDALTEEEKLVFDREVQQALKERKKREMERLAKELQEKKLQQELERQKEEDELKRRTKKAKGVKDEPQLKRSHAAVSRQGLSFSRPEVKSDTLERKVSVREQSQIEKEDLKKKKNQLAEINLMGVPLGQEPEESEMDLSKDSEKSLAQKFRDYELTLKDVQNLLLSWDRKQCVLLPHAGIAGIEDLIHEPDDQRQAPSGGRRGRKDRERERAEKERAEKERQEREKAERERLERLRAQDKDSDGWEVEGEEDHEGKKDLGVPFINITTPDPEGVNWKQALENERLPRADQILDILGLGSAGPPIPPSTLFSIVPYPVKRQPLASLDTLKHFVFINPSSEDSSQEDKREIDIDPEPATPSNSIKLPEDQGTLQKGSKQKQKEKQEQLREAQKEKRRLPTNRKTLNNNISGPLATLSDIDQNTLTRQQSQEKFLRLSQFRWVVPPGGEVTLRIHFSSGDIGNFDQTFNFEILGTRRLYQLYCRGICSYPYICSDPKVVFSQRKPDIKPDEVVFKKYVASTDRFYFGPLLCGKSRDKYKTSLFPGNSETLTILNNSPMLSEVFFCFQNDVKANTYFLEPMSMVLKPGESQLLNVWAYPTAVGNFEDYIVCCVKENPEPTIFNICCQGVRPELELETKQLHFDRLLLHRRETKVIVLRNITPLPAAWRISSMEHLGEDFTLPIMQGTVPPKGEQNMIVHFQPSKPVSVKKTLRLEILDVDNIVGIVQVENVMLFAESYDIALDIVFPKGAEGGLDMGTVKVMEDIKQPLLLKNRGKYEIMFSFSVDPVGAPTNISSMISVQPKKGSLTTTEKPVNVHVHFRAKKEMRIEHQPILRCQIIEPSMVEGGEIIASIPIKFSVNAVYSKYSINPSTIINFGALIYGTRKSSSFTIENHGVTDFKFVLFRMTGDIPMYQKKGGHMRNPRSRESEIFHKSSSLKAAKFSESMAREVNIPNQARFTSGMFTVYPGFGAIMPGGSQVITVDCLADPMGKCEEYVGIDISDRDPRDQPGGIPYTLLAEACVPAFVTDNNALIFEEHQICDNASLSSTLLTLESGGVFVEDENRFFFCNVLVGHQAKARFKISNIGKIACDVNIVVKPVSSKIFARIIDIFDVEPNKICVASHSSAFATVTFTPQALQTYQCIFEVNLDGLPSSLTKNRSLTFDILGEGTLPRVTVLRPILHDHFGNPLMLFKKLLLGRSEAQSIQLKNTGNIAAQLHIDLRDPLGVYTLKGKLNTSYIYLMEDNKPQTKAKKAHTASLVVPPGEIAEFDVVLQSQKVGRMTGQIHLSVVHNQYEETNIHLVGEGYEDDITVDNIHGLLTSISQENGISLSGEESTIDDLVAVAMIDHIQFGDCHVGNSYTLSFTLTNHSKVNVLRFEWPILFTISFSPQIGHLHPECAKDIVVTLKSDLPISLKKLVVKCKISKILFQLPTDQVPDWDDRMRTVKWVDTPRTTPGVFTTKCKVIETDPEPAHSIVEENHQDLQIQISANVNFAQYECQKYDIRFKETLVYQTRIFEINLTNTGMVKLEFSWTSEEAGKIVSFAMPESLGSAQRLQLSQGTLPTGSTIESTVDRWPETTVPPFSVDPSSGVIPAGKTQKLNVKFSPVEVGDFESNLYCLIPNLPPGEQGPTVTTKGRSCLPYCHFDLKDSNYISGHRRAIDLRGPGGGPLDPATRVIEFNSVGIGGKTIQSFTILNPTSNAYSFFWVPEETESLQNPPAFTCLTEKGNIYPDKRAEIIFHFTPSHLDITEAFWTFSIPEHNITVPFLLVGQATDPLLKLNKAHLNFSSLLIGREARESVTIINKEDQSFQFAFLDSSRYSEGYGNCLVVSPMEGWVPPKSSFPIDIFFTPKLEGEVNFNLICNVKRKVNPLTLNVKAEGYATNVEVKFKDSSGINVVLTPNQINTINFYEVEINECVQYEFTFINTGKFSFSFQAEISGSKTLLQYLEFSPIESNVDAGQTAHASLLFQPTKKCVLKGLELKFKISHGPTFVCSIIGSAVTPAVHFSFTSYNFGTCFIYQAGMPPYKQSLFITNKEENSMSIDCLYTNTSHLEVNFHRDVIKPGKTLEVPIIFYPRDSITYRELVPFEINGLSQQLVEIKGSGTELKITVVEPRSKVVKLGAVQPGQVVKKTVCLLNSSLAPITFNHSLLFSSPELHEPKVITLIPFYNITLKPKEVEKLEVTFAPKKRIPPFSEEVFMECLGLLRPLFLLSGCCQALEICLEQDHLSFGSVVCQTQASRRILMQNTGDLGAKFKWDVKKFEPHFSISPEEGYITAGTDVSFEVTYHPTEVGKENICKQLLCTIQGSSPLSLTLTGTCVGPPSAKEVVNFTCQVRSKHTQTIMLSNRTNQTWNLHPIFEGEHWEGPEFITLEPHQQNKPYEITYRPRTMNVENRKHQGSVFFPLPDGTGWLYSLHGVSEQPKAVANIYREVPCKTPYTELLPINNWLNKPQRFRVIVEMIKPEKPDLSVTLKGLDYIDVLSGSKKDYKLNFYSYREGMYSAKVIFRNEQTSEFLFYTVSFKAIPSGVIKTIEMVSLVRQSTSASIKLENPLTTPVTFSVDCRLPDISLPTQFTMPANSESMFSFEFQPLKAGESFGKLTLHNSDLGYYFYELSLKALPALPEKPVYFQVVLGSSQSIFAKFINYTRQKTEYYCRTDCPDFHVEKVIIAPPGAQGGTEVSVEVYFEPSRLGETKGLLQLTSLIGGEYIIPLFGKALPPKPQGPFLIRAGYNILIPFKNVFFQAVTFSFSVEHPAFTIRAMELMRPKKINNIAVSFEGNPSSSKAPITSKLIVSCPPSEGNETGVQWVYYLKGITP